jgi:predicted short-subunit dehydrogenase-like oxidoreductase (DUF2520 family)
MARWAVARGARLEQVAGRTAGGRATALAVASGGSPVALDELISAGQQLLLVAVPDPALDAVVAALAPRPQAPVALHTSGSRDASALAALRARGSAVGSLHPLRAFAEDGVAPLARGFYAVDGDAAAQNLARRLAAAWGGEAAAVLPAARRLYHLGATLAAGGVVTLLAAATEIAQRADLPAAVARGYLELARSALDQAERRGGARAAITGPVVRGERELVRAQLAELQRAVPELAPLVRRLARETLRQAGASAPLDEAQRALLEALGGPGENP